MQEVALLAQVVEQLHKKRERLLPHAISHEFAYGQVLHLRLEAIEIGHDLVFQRDEQVLLVAEVIVEGTSVEVGAGAEVVHRNGVETALFHEADERRAQCALRFGDASVHPKPVPSPNPFLGMPPKNEHVVQKQVHYTGRTGD